MDWCEEEMDRDLKPEYLLDDFTEISGCIWRRVWCKKLLMLEDIRVKAMIAGALADMPEFLIDQIGKANNKQYFSFHDKGNGTDCRCCRRKVGGRKE